MNDYLPLVALNFYDLLDITYLNLILISEIHIVRNFSYYQLFFVADHREI